MKDEGVSTIVFSNKSFNNQSKNFHGLDQKPITFNCFLSLFIKDWYKLIKRLKELIKDQNNWYKDQKYWFISK